MTATELIALIALVALVVLILQNAAKIPDAIATLLRACLPVVHATRNLITAIKQPSDLPGDTNRDENTEIP